MATLSIITINYNDVEGLQKTIESVFSQTFKDFEYLIIDGGSTDGSLELIRQHAGKFTYWVSEHDKGIYDAINKGINTATGDYLMFLNSGDYLLSEDTLEYAKAIVSKEQFDIYYGNVVMEKASKEKYIQQYPAEMSLNFWQRRTINHQACFIKSSLFTELGLYDARYSMAADYAFFLKAYISGKRYSHIDRELIYYPLDGFSSRNLEKYLLQMKDAWENIVPEYIKHLHRENNEYRLLMKHVIMAKAKRLNNVFQAVKSFFSRSAEVKG